MLINDIQFRTNHKFHEQYFKLTQLRMLKLFRGFSVFETNYRINELLIKFIRVGDVFRLI